MQPKPEPNQSNPTHNPNQPGQMPALNPSFSDQTPGLQLVWDSTSIGALKTCPRYYQYSIVEGWQAREQSPHLTFGLHYHTALECYDHAKAQGATHEEAQLLALEKALKLTWNQTLNRPWLSNNPYKNRDTLVRSVVWYLEEFANDPLETVRLADGKPAVELTFKLQTTYQSLSGEAFWLSGHLDRLARLDNKTYVVDRKTSKNQIDQTFFEKFSPDNQMSTYAFAATIAYAKPVSGIFVDGAQIAVTFSRFLRGPVPRSSDQLDEWYKGLEFLFSEAESYTEARHWPMNEKSCSNYGGCQFRGVCSKPPSTRQDWLKASYTKRIWNPLANRGDI